MVKKTQESEKKLKNPPISEAIVGVAFTKENKLTLAEITKLKNEIEKTGFIFFEKTYKREFEIDFQEKNTAISKNNSNQNGFLLKKDNLILFLEKNRITLKQIKQYKTYENFIQKYKILLDILIKQKKLIKTNDIGLRYINKFDLKNERINKYKIQPLLGKSNNVYSLSDFRSSYKLSSAKYGLNVIINSSITAKNTNYVSIVFDIDVHKNEEIVIQQTQDILNILKVMRELKNCIFFENLDKPESMEEFK